MNKNYLVFECSSWLGWGWTGAQASLLSVQPLSVQHRFCCQISVVLPTHIQPFNMQHGFHCHIAWYFEPVLLTHAHTSLAWTQADQRGPACSS